MVSTSGKFHLLQKLVEEVISEVRLVSQVWKTVVFITSRPWKSFALLKQTQQQCRRFEMSGIKNEETLILEILRKLGDPNPQQSHIKFLDDVRESNMS